MLAETIDVAKRAKLATEQSLAEVFVDTTIQPKAISYQRNQARYFKIVHDIRLEIGSSNDLENLWPLPLALAKKWEIFKNNLVSAVHGGTISHPIKPKAHSERYPMKIMTGVFCLLMMAPAAFAGPRVGQAQLVDYVDIERFMGDWYVHGHTPTLVDNHTMNQVESYKLEEDGTIATTYTFYRKYPGGFQFKFTPRGRVYDTVTNAHWKMQFVWPFKGNFLVVRLAPDYSYTVITVPKKDLIWIMSRAQEMDNSQYDAIVKDLAADGYPVENIRRVPQKW